MPDFHSFSTYIICNILINGFKTTTKRPEAANRIYTRQEVHYTFHDVHVQVGGSANTMFFMAGNPM
jgi:hypothetical protein